MKLEVYPFSMRKIPAKSELTCNSDTRRYKRGSILLKKLELAGKYKINNKWKATPYVMVE